MTMRLPFLQISNELLDYTAPDVAALLEWPDAFAGLVRAIRWRLSTSADDKPPSESATVTGPDAARLIARAAGYTGDAEHFVDACCRASHPLLERVPDGIRFRGLDRYDEAWRKARAKSERARAAAVARWSHAPVLDSTAPDATNATRIAQALPEHCTSTAQAMPSAMLPDAHIQTQIQTEAEPKKETSAVAAQARLVFAHWQTVMRKPRAKYDDKRKRLVEQRLREGHSVDELREAITGCSRSTFHVQNRYTGLGLILRDSVHIERFRELAGMNGTARLATTREQFPELPLQPASLDELEAYDG